MSDLLYWTVAGVGTLGCVYLFYLNGWDVEETLFGHTSEQEMEIFARRLLSMPQIRTCPHGRPVMIEMTRREMEKSFGRV